MDNFRLNLTHLKPLLNDDESYELVSEDEGTMVRVYHVDSVGKRTVLAEIDGTVGDYLEMYEVKE